MNVQELTVIKSVEIRKNVEGRNILGLVETNVRLIKMERRYVVGDKKEGGLSLLKIRDIIVVKLVLRKLSIFITVVYIDFKDREK